MSLTKVSFSMITGAPANVKDFGAIGDGVTNDTAAIQAAIASLPNGGMVFFPAGVYTINSTIVLGKNIRYVGAGKSIDVTKNTTIKYTGALDAFVDINPVNAPIAANMRFENINFWYVTATVSQKKGLFHLLCSTFVDFISCGFSGGEYGVILDQAEIINIRDCDFESQTTGQLWLTNGADKTVGANELYTNRINVDGCQLNTGTAICIVDDGGLSHSFTNNNFNAGNAHIRLCGVEACLISGNELELGSAQSVITQTTKFGGGTPTVSRCFGLSLISNYFFQTAAGASAIEFTANSVYSVAVLNNMITTAAAVPAIVGPTNPTEAWIFGNYQAGAGTAPVIRFTGTQTMTNGSGFNFSEFTSGKVAGTITNSTLLHYEEGTFTPVVTFGGASVGITGSFIGKYTKVGRQVNITLTLAFSSKGISTGAMLVTGLPYTTTIVATFGGSVGFVSNLASAYDIQPWINESANQITMQKGNLASSVNMVDTDILNNTRIDMSISYMV